MISIKIHQNDAHPLHFDNYSDIVKYLRNQALPWGDMKKCESTMHYKKQVAKRARIKYGAKADIRILSDKDFIYDLYSLGELYELKEIRDDRRHLEMPC